MTDGSGYTLDVSDSYELLTGIKKEELIGRHVETLVRKGYFKPAVTPQVIKRRIPVSIEQKISTTGKQVIITGNPIFNGDGNLIFVASMVEPFDARNSKKIIDHHLTFDTPELPGMIVASRAMKEVIIKARQVAPLDTTVLITGETGTGKDVLARGIHHLSRRRNRPFVSMNAAAIPSELLESELFGYVGGAFTGALKEGKTGLVEAAEGGTVFLDEIGDLAPGTQSKLLRLLQDKEVMPVGSVQSKHVDVRFIAATNHDLRALVRNGSFREDLYYRLGMLTIYIPPLRERKEDVPFLCRYFMDNGEYNRTGTKRISTRALSLLTDYSWPGNIRELQGLIERLSIFYQGEEITADHVLKELPVKSVYPQVPIESYISYNLQQELEHLERKIISRVIDEQHGDYQSAAAILGIHRTTLMRKLKKYGVKTR